MACQFHPDRPVSASCADCGALICEGCSVELEDRTVCKSCIERLYEENRRSARTTGRPAGRPAYEYHYEHTARPKAVSALLVFLFSAVPGAAHMYMGLMKRGVFIMGSFFFTIAIMSFLYLPGVFGLIIPVIFFLSFFDALNTRKRINRGETPEDEIDSIFNFIRENKKIFVVLGVATGLMVISSVFRGIGYGYYHGHSNWFFPILLIIAGAMFLRKRRCVRRPGERPEDELHREDTKDNF